MNTAYKDATNSFLLQIFKRNILILHIVIYKTYTSLSTTATIFVLDKLRCIVSIKSLLLLLQSGYDTVKVLLQPIVSPEISKY